MKRKHTIAILVFIAILVTGLSFGYYMRTSKSNELNINIGEGAEGTVELSQLTGVGMSLMPQGARSSTGLETSSMKFRFTYKTEGNMEYTITHDLPEGLYISGYDETTIYQSNTYYEIYLLMDAPLQVTTYNFYIYARLK